MSVLLQASDLRRAAGEHTLFQGLDLTVRAGDRPGLAGHNGSGRTTLLEVLSGARPPDRGEIRRRRDLRLARVEQFLPGALAQVSLLEAIWALAEGAAERWRARRNIRSPACRQPCAARSRHFTAGWTEVGS